MRDMDKKKRLEKLKEENEYYRVEFLEKQKQNKKSFAERIFLELISCFDKSEYSINQQERTVEISNINNQYLIELLTDINSNPKEPLIFQYNKLEKGTEKHLVFLIRPFNNSPLPNPDFNRLKENPYKGMDLLDIEMVEKQKDIDFFKEFIQSDFKFEDYIYSCHNKQTDKSLGEFANIKELVGQIK